MSRSPVRKYLTMAAKVAIVVALLYFLASRRFLSPQKTKDALSHWQLMVPAALIMIFNLWLGMLRWQWLLQAHDIHLRFRRTAQLALIGNFFNLALPGAVSGDFVKAFYIGHEVPGKRGHAFGSILFDRVAGLSALVLLAAGALIADYRHFVGTPLFAAIKVFVLAAAAAVLVFYTYLFLVREHHDPVLLALRKLAARFTKTNSLVRIYEGLRHYHNHRLTVLKVLAVSVVVHALIGWACLQFVHALGGDVPLEVMYIIVPLGLLVTAVPVAPAGVGTGHLAFSSLFNLVGFTQGADVFTIFTVFSLLFGSVGGVVYLWFRGHEPAPVLGPGAAREEVTHDPVSLA